jgi:hypothetical protein
VFQNKVLRRMFGPKREEVTEGWRELHNEEFYNLCSSSYVISMMKSRRMRLVENVSCMGKMRNARIQWIRGWVEPRVSLDMGMKRKNFCPCQDSNLGFSSLSQSLLSILPHSYVLFIGTVLAVT